MVSYNASIVQNFFDNLKCAMASNYTIGEEIVFLTGGFTLFFNHYNFKSFFTKKEIKTDKTILSLSKVPLENTSSI